MAIDILTLAAAKADISKLSEEKADRTAVDALGKDVEILLGVIASAEVICDLGEVPGDVPMTYNCSVSPGDEIEIEYSGATAGTTVLTIGGCAQDGGSILEYWVTANIVLKETAGTISHTVQSATGFVKIYVGNTTLTVKVKRVAKIERPVYVESVTQTSLSAEDGGVNTVEIKLTDGTITTFDVKNGSKGSQGNSGYTGAAGELEVVNNLTQGGETAALSAEMGKKIGKIVEGLSVVNLRARGVNDGDDIYSAVISVLSEYEGTGAVIYLPAGTYYVSTEINMQSKFCFIGDGMGKTIIKTTGTSGAVFIGENLSDYIYSDFTIDGSLNNDGWRKGIFQLYVTNVVYRNLQIINTGATGLGSDYCINCVFENIFCDSCGLSGDLDSGLTEDSKAAGCSGIGVGSGETETGNEGLIISNCHCNNCRQYGIFVETQIGGSGSVPVGVTIIGCTASGNRAGFGVSGYDSATFIGCHAYKNHRAGFEFSDTTMGQDSDSYAYSLRSRFIACTAKQNGAAIPVGYPEFKGRENGFGFVCACKMTGMELIGCNAIENLLDGVCVEKGISNISIIGGTVTGNGRNGISFSGDVNGIVAKPAFVYNNVGNGIYFNGAIQNGVVKDAVVYGNGIGLCASASNAFENVIIKDNIVCNNTTNTENVTQTY